jgi:GR25 family glycosyltransferase involved in LPS biosynthesis
MTTLTADQLLDILAQADRSSPFFAHASALLDDTLVRGGFRNPEVGHPAARKTLTIGMATYDDYDGVYFSVQAIRLFHPEVTGRTEIVIVDNQPEGPSAAALRRLAQSVEACRYIPMTRINGTSVRESIFREAAGDFVLAMDSHVLFAPGSLRALLDYVDANPDSNDLLQGPLIADDLTGISTHFEPVWSHGMWGVWARDERGIDPCSPPFEIPMHGLGVFACRREAWQGFNPRLRGFGGEEGCIHEKFRRAGAKTLCLPFLRWLHRFDRPRGIAYPGLWEDRIRNYLTLFEELGLDQSPVVRHFEELLGAETAGRIVENVRREIAGPFHFFDAIYCINVEGETERWKSVMKRFQELGIAERVRRFPAIETPSNHHIGCALSHRSVIAEARKYGLRNVLVFEDDVIFAPDTLDALGRSVAELRGRSWGMLFLGGCAWGKTYEKAEGCTYLEVPRRMTCSHALAYHESIYDRILGDVPDTPTAVAIWLRTEFAIDQYYGRRLDGLMLLTSPVVATQESILSLETRSFETTVRLPVDAAILASVQ